MGQGVGEYIKSPREYDSCRGLSLLPWRLDE